MQIKLYPDNPSSRSLDAIAAILDGGGVIIYPTDGVYAFGCSVRAPRGVERMCSFRGKELRRLTLVCDSIASAAEYVKIDDTAFGVLKQNTPGRFTFILPALSRIPDKAIIGRRRNMGVRIPDNGVALAILRHTGVPMLSMSVREAEQIEYMTDPELLDEKYGRVVDAVVNGGYGSVVPTTVVDMTGGDVEIIRQAEAELE